MVRFASVLWRLGRVALIAAVVAIFGSGLVRGAESTQRGSADQFPTGCSPGDPISLITGTVGGPPGKGAPDPPSNTPQSALADFLAQVDSTVGAEAFRAQDGPGNRVIFTYSTGRPDEEQSVLATAFVEPTLDIYAVSDFISCNSIVAPRRAANAPRGSR